MGEVQRQSLQRKLRKVDGCNREAPVRTGRELRVVGSRMIGRQRDVNQGSRAGSSDGVHDLQCGSEEPCPEGDRVSVRAKKRSNARGAKGDRDVVTADTVTGTTKTGVVLERAMTRQRSMTPRSTAGFAVSL